MDNPVHQVPSPEEIGTFPTEGFSVRRFVERHGVLMLLTLVGTIAAIDRFILGILQESIKRDLHLSDGQLGLLTGFGFALFYSAFGLPLGRIADRWSRRDLIVISMIVWSGMTALTGVARSFSQFLWARVGVAIGEAGCNPPSYSLISDHYAPRHRAAAFGVYYMSSYLGMLFGFLAGGRLEHIVGWRTTFMIVGIPGLLVAVLLRVLVKEPRRVHSAAVGRSFVEGLRHLAAQKTLRRLTVAVAFNSIAMFGLLNWAAPLLIRVRHMTTAEAGTYMSVAVGVGGMCGQVIVGMLANRLAVRDARWYLWLSAIIAVVVAILLCAALLVPGDGAARVLLVVPFAISATYGLTCLSVINGTVPPELRATASATFLLVCSIGGLGLGVWSIGVISDALNAVYGASSIQYAMLAVLPATSILAALFFLYTARSVKRTLSDWK